MLKQKYQFKNYNWVLIGAVLILSGMGVLFINSADSSYTSKQLVGLIFCTGVMLFLSVVNFNFVCGFNRVLYMINIVLLVLVKLVGVSVNGAQRWINLGFTRLQPSELTKIIMIIFVAVYIQEHEEDLMEWKVLLKLALCPSSFSGSNRTEPVYNIRHYVYFTVCHFCRWIFNGFN